MGKTSLARAALHHSETCSKFQARFFVSAEAATTAVELAALIGLHLGLDPGSNLIKPVVQYFAQQTSSCLLVLDNLETPWEPQQSRSAVEELISLLTDVDHLALIVGVPLVMFNSGLTTRQITMRGVERPSKVQWSRPFLLPLEPLPNDAALHPEALVQSLRKLFHHLLALYQVYNDSRLSSVLAQITANLANLDEVLQWGLQPQSLDLAETIESINSLNSFHRITRSSGTHLLDKIPIHLCGPRQRVLHNIECLKDFPGEIQTQKLLAEGISQFQYFQDPTLEGTPL